MRSVLEALGPDLDVSRPVLDAAGIEALNPQRGPMRQLDSVLRWTEDPAGAVALRDVRDDEFWVPHHVPGRALFPAVLMIEASAQLASLVATRLHPEMGFVGLGGVRRARFARVVVPGDRLLLVARVLDGNRRLLRCAVEGVVDGERAFSVEVAGVAL